MSQQRKNLSRRLYIFSTLLVLCVFAGVTQAKEFTNFLGMQFITIPAGSFQMGSPASSDVAYTNEFPQHTVTLKSFPLSKVEITLGHFKRYIIETDQIDIVTDGFMSANAHGDNAPVVYVSWNDIKGFLTWLNESKPESDTATYRLPSEAEWEYACRAGADKPYCGGNVPSIVAWHSAISGSHQQTVGRKAANAFGIHDMSGNALEWVEDCYHETYDGAPSDGSAWTEKCSSNNRSLRGGSWNDNFRKVRVTIRKNAPSVNRNKTVGFRIVRDI